MFCDEIFGLFSQICMGMCPDISEEDKRAKIQSSKIEQALNEHARAEINTVKILLLGNIYISFILLIKYFPCPVQ